MSTRKLTDWLVYVAVRIVICIAQALRMETCHTIARLLAVFACDIVKLRGQVVEENLQAVFPELTAAQRHKMARDMWEHLFLMGAEIVHAPRKIRRTTWHKYITIDNERRFMKHIFDARPMMVVSGHFGNFELGGYSFGMLGFPTYIVARPLDNPYLDRYINRLRAANGQFIVSNRGSAIQLDQVLATGGTMMSLGDQYAGPKGCWVDFLGRPASCHKAISLFTLTSDAPMLVVYFRREGKPMRFLQAVEDVIDPATMGEDFAGVKPLTQWYNDRLERIVRAAPEQYWWLHRRWKGTPPARRAARRHAAA